MFTFCVNRVQKMALIYVAFMFMLGYNFWTVKSSQKEKFDAKILQPVVAEPAIMHIG